MKRQTMWLSVAVLVFLPLVSSRAQEVTSREIPFYLLTSLPPGTTQEVVVELWDAGIGGNLLFDEPYTGSNALLVDSTGAIGFTFGSLHQPTGLNPDDFPSGSSRYLDVTQGGGSVLTARQALMAAAFALSPGPQGPPGPNDITGNLTMVNSTQAAGNIMKGGVPFIHNFGPSNTFLGSNAGNFTMSGGNNIAVGSYALFRNSSGANNTVSGYQALYSNTTGYINTASGYAALISNTSGSANTASGGGALSRNTNGYLNTASGYNTLFSNTLGSANTASGGTALFGNTIGDNNTAIGYAADVSVGNLSNATAIGAYAVVNASNKVRVGDANVTVIEGQVGFTSSSDRNKKENLRPVAGEEVLGKIQGLRLTSWNFIGHDPKQFRHYGPMAQDFFAAFGHDGIGTIGTDTTITSTDMDGILMIAAQALEKRTEALRAENAKLKARLEALERRMASYALTKAE